MPPTPTVPCPQCKWNVSISADQRNKMVTCPACKRAFRAPVAPAWAVPTGRLRPGELPRDRASHLTAPHRCLVLGCKGEINQAFGKRHTSIVHEECLRSTDIYAALYFCPHCTTRRTFLESPRWQWGQKTTCPVCAEELVVPNDDILREVDPQRREGRWFSFICPACDGELRCNTRHARTSVVCLHCQFAIVVPDHGETDAPSHSHPDLSRQAVQPVGNFRCPGCGQLIPRGSGRCPICREGL